MKKKLILFYLLFFIGICVGGGVTAQTQVRGNVTDESGQPVIGASILVKGTGYGIVSDVDGNFTITVPADFNTLIISYIGMKTQEVKVSPVLRIILQTDTELLEEVIVVGYGTQKRQFIVGSVSQVTNKDLVKAPMSNVSNMMTGKLPGLTSIQRSGQPGSDQTSILVRGASTFNDSSPLFIVDGVERSINSINPNDIETISILKDAATAAIYGVRGANGVVLVTTKSGSVSETKITYNGSITFTTNTSMPEMLNAKDYIGWHNKAREMDGLNPIYTEEAIEQMKVAGIYGETDWLNLLFKDYGYMHQHNISAAGGTENVKYYTSVGLMKQEGIVPNTNYDRYNVRGNIDAKIANNLNFILNLSGYRTKKHAPGYDLSPQYEFSPIMQALYSLPILASTYNGLNQGYMNGSYTQQPLAAVNESGYQNTTSFNFEGSAKLEYDFKNISALQGLKAGVFVAYDYSNTTNRNFLQSYKLYSFSTTTMTSSIVNASGIILPSEFTKSASYGDSFTVRPQITYDRVFNNRHAVGGLLFYEQRKGYSDTMTGRKNGYYASYPVDLSIGNTWEGISTPVTGSFDETGIASFGGRFNYALNRKYLAEVLLRADASYKFDPDNRWGYFPSIALGWVISEENFFRKALPFVEFLKLRTSYGELGSDDTSSYLYMQAYRTTAPNYAYILNGSGQTAYYTSNYIHSGLTWSRTRSYNIAFDLSMLNGRLGVEFDWFYKVTDDILEKVSGSYAPSLGGNVPSYANTGKVDNRGFELTLKHNNRINSDWSYSLTGSLSFARNKVLARQISDDHPMYRAVLGKSMGSIYGFKAIGLFQTQEQIDNTPTAPSGTKRLGDIMYADINGDGKIDASKDYVKIGRSYTPEMNFSLNMDASYKNVYLTALWQGVALCSYQLSGVYNSDVPDNTMYTRAFYSSGNAPYYLVEGAWREENTNAKYPRLSTVANGNNAWPSSWWTKDGSYLRLKNLQIGYMFPDGLLKHTGINSINAYIAGSNLLTFSSFKYVDPEMPSVNNGYYPQQRTYSIGLNVTF